MRERIHTLFTPQRKVKYEVASFDRVSELESDASHAVSKVCACRCVCVSVCTRLPVLLSVCLSVSVCPAVSDCPPFPASPAPHL